MARSTWKSSASWKVLSAFPISIWQSQKPRKTTITDEDEAHADRFVARAGVRSSVFGRAGGDGFNDVVKAIEQFYHVKHQSVPFLARAGMKAARTAAKIKGGEWKQLAEAGSVRVVFFEDRVLIRAARSPASRHRCKRLCPEWSYSCRRFHQRTSSRLISSRRGRISGARD